MMGKAKIRAWTGGAVLSQRTEARPADNLVPRGTHRPTGHQILPTRKALHHLYRVMISFSTSSNVRCLVSGTNLM
jgi:hypothetical protein